MMDSRTEQICYLKDRVMYLEEKYNDTLRENKRLKEKLRHVSAKSS